MAKQITQEEFDKLKKKLNSLKNEGRAEIALKLDEARSHGDLSENAEYDEARNDQAKLEDSILQLERELEEVEIVDDDFFQKGTVHVGSLVTIDDGGEEIKCFIGSMTDLEDVIAITDDSPVGMAVMGKKKGDEVIVNAPSGSRKIKIINTEYKKNKKDSKEKKEPKEKKESKDKKETKDKKDTKAKKEKK
jgi:transcription elongation factor GreA